MFDLSTDLSTAEALEIAQTVACGDVSRLPDLISHILRRIPFDRYKDPTGVKSRDDFMQIAAIVVFQTCAENKYEFDYRFFGRLYWCIRNALMDEINPKRRVNKIVYNQRSLDAEVTIFDKASFLDVLETIPIFDISVQEADMVFDQFIASIRKTLLDRAAETTTAVLDTKIMFPELSQAAIAKMLKRSVSTISLAIKDIRETAYYLLRDAFGFEKEDFCSDNLTAQEIVFIRSLAEFLY